MGHDRGSPFDTLSLSKVQGDTDVPLSAGNSPNLKRTLGPSGRGSDDAGRFSFVPGGTMQHQVRSAIARSVGVTLAVLFIAISLVFPASAATTGTISGTVVDAATKK